MNNEAIILKALTDLGSGWHTSREVMLQARRNGWQMTTARARGICRHLHRKQKVAILIYGGRYSFEVLPIR
jgi:hypothetical protein